jgi:DNA-binding NarL/FixJ family response regulator
LLDDRPIVLVAGTGRSSFERLAPLLDRQRVEVVQVTSVEDAGKLAYSERVDLVILDGEPAEMSLAEVVRIIRAGSSASSRCSLLILAQHGRADAALALVGRGVNRVMLSGDPPELLDQLVAELLHIAPRTTLRLATRFLAEVADGAEEALGAVVNLSATGMLVETDADLERGQHVVLSLDLGAELEPLVLKAEVVRRADPARDGVVGFGLRFLDLPAASRARLGAILDRAFRRPGQ